MAHVLVYTSPARGHIFPLVPTLLELQRRGHTVHVRTLAAVVPQLVGLGFAAAPIAAAIEGRSLDDWRAPHPLAAVDRTFGTFLDRAEHEVGDLHEALAATQADLAYVDVNCLGALAAAEASGIPFAVFAPYFLPLKLRGRPPLGPGFAPAAGVLGRLRDALVWAVTGRALRPHVVRLNALRRRLGLAPIASLDALTARADRVVAYTAAPLEYAHPDWPSHVRFVGPGIWEPPGDEADASAVPPSTRPLVLVTCSTEYQNDGALVETALAALADEDLEVIATTAALDPAAFRAPPNARVLRFAPHGPLLRRAAAVVCHGGMGITQKALAAGVPVCVVPWGRDQLDVARHVEVAGAGRRVPRGSLTVPRLRAAVRETIALRDGARRVAEAFAAAGGPPAAADALEELLPAHDLRSATA